MTRIAVALDGRQLTDAVCGALEREGIRVRFRCRTGAEAIRAINNMGGGILICSYRFPDMTANDIQNFLGNKVTVLLIGKAYDICFGDREMTKLQLPIKKSELIATVRMLIKIDTVKDEPSPKLRSAEDINLINKAKSILMQTQLLTEPEAHRYLQRKSMEACRSMAQTAQNIIDSSEERNSI